jgi:hypothetical protein
MPHATRPLAGAEKTDDSSVPGREFEGEQLQDGMESISNTVAQTSTARQKERLGQGLFARSSASYLPQVACGRDRAPKARRKQSQLEHKSCNHWEIVMRDVPDSIEQNAFSGYCGFLPAVRYSAKRLTTARYASNGGEGGIRTRPQSQ